jgi:L-2-hydroxycarboxylate dehydrogenase (NAD+)
MTPTLAIDRTHRRAAVALVRDFRGSSRMPGVDRIFVPGERSQDTRAARTCDGIAIAPALMRGLDQLADELGVAKLA